MNKEENRKNKKAYKVSRGKRGDFDRMEGKGILKVRNEIQAKSGKN